MDENRVKSFHPVATTIKLAKFSQTRIYVPESEKKKLERKKRIRRILFSFSMSRVSNVSRYTKEFNCSHFSLFSFAPLESNPFTRVRWLIEREKDD